jgi:hypothetical protein
MPGDSVTIEVPAGRFTARPYRADDEERVLELWRLAFGKPLEPEIWRWKYAENPFGSRILLCLDERGEAPVVMYSGVPLRANWNGRQVEIVQLMDIMSDPDYRKTGLFVKTAEAYFDRFAGGDSVLYYGIPGRYHFEIGARYLAYSGLESGVAFYQGNVRKIGDLFVAGGRVRAEEHPGRDCDALWQRLSEFYPLAAVRDRAFLRWRFFNHPRRRYTLYSYRTGLFGRLRAWAVVATEERTARIADLLLPPNVELGAAFLTRLARVLRLRGVERIETWVPGSHFAAETLAGAGLEQSAEPLGIIPTARSFDGDLGIPWVSDTLYYTMADADLV